MNLGGQKSRAEEGGGPSEQGGLKGGFSVLNITGNWGEKTSLERGVCVRARVCKMDGLNLT